MGLKVTTLSALFLINVLITTSARQRTSDDLETVKVLKRAENHMDNAIAAITEAKDDSRTEGGTSELPGEKLIKEELDMLSEDALKLREILRSARGDVEGNLENGNAKDSLKEIQSDAAVLYEDTKDLISDVLYERKVKTHTSVDFDRDLQLVKNETGRTLDLVRELDAHKKRQKTGQRKRRKHKKKEKRIAITKDSPSKSKNQLHSDAGVRDNRPTVTPISEDLPFDDVPYSRTGGFSVPEPLTFARPHDADFDTSWLSRYLQACPQCTTLSEDKQCPLTSAALEMKKWANELQEILTHGCIKPAGCDYPGTCCIASDLPIEQTVTSVTRLLKDLYDMLLKTCTRCSKDAMLGDNNWSQWGPWGNCDTTCGRGTRSRFRRCDKPGGDCQGSSTERELCGGNPECCINGNWGSWQHWSQCSVTCGRGVKERRRLCDNPSANFCGQTCPGNDRERDHCDSGTACTVCVDGGWSEWEIWGACSATCGRGQTTRRRRCSRPAPSMCGKSCVGPRDETRACESNRDCCVNGNWGQWQEWSLCSATCGAGTRARRRACDSPRPNQCGQDCRGLAQEMGKCDARVPCTVCVDGNWGFWSSWTACSSSCGEGKRTRTRACNNPPPSSCGRECPGELQQVVSCLNPPSLDAEWGFWQAWSACSVTCGRGGQRTRRRECDIQGLGRCARPCVGTNTETVPCNSERECCVDGNWGPWGPWPSCSVTCGQGTRERRRLCDNPPANHCGQRCPGRSFEVDMCDTQRPCITCVNGNWSPWQAWSRCSVSCGEGVYSRRRQCANPPANECGLPCPGRDAEQGTCDTKVPCLVCVNGNWGPWQSWSRCSVSCGQGLQSRRRQCNNPSANECGLPCQGRGTEQGECDTNVPCLVCVNGNWGPWQPWSPCSVSCGQGLRNRRKQCNNPSANECGLPCPGRDTEQGECNTNVPCLVCVNGNWGPWQPWSPCSVSCGQGVYSRRRQCNNPPANECGLPCQGRDTEQGECNTNVPCLVCVNGNWGPWQPWSPCSVSCGQGVYSRRRQCNNPPANECGLPCQGRDSEQGQCDTNVPCQVCINGNWGNWLGWSECSVTCGPGSRSRQRFCDSPEPNYCGEDCPGQARDIDECDSEPCRTCIDGSWSSWQPWSSCSVTCGRGTIERRRSCDSPPANQCGQPCPGREFDTEVCDTFVTCEDPCVENTWGMWQPWTRCSVTCGRGLRERRRSCDSPSFNSCGNRCPGQDFNTEVCETGLECQTCVENTWGMWQPWTRCSVTCGRGLRERRRSCDSPSFNSCGNRCPGQELNTEVCETGLECQTCVENTWGMWQPWTRCSVTCGRGLRERRRSCDSPSFNSCGNRCPGQELNTELCETGRVCEICVDGNWGAWQNWSPCSVTCGSGFRQRSRSCDNPPANQCGRNCPGDSYETAVCDSSASCAVCVNGQWSPWSDWSTCSVSCGIGSITRSRTCSNPYPNVCGTTCPGQTDERVTCIGAGLCGCARVEWTPWEPWGPCSTTCGAAFRSRARQCLVVEPGNDCGQQCIGSNQENSLCEGQPPCSWGEWTACSITCRGRGVRERIIATVVVPGRGDVTVQTNATRREVEECVVNEPECPSWTQWSACSVTCRGRGFRERIITTHSIVESGTGTSVANATRTEVEECVVTVPECPSWSEWSACSATCRGQGSRQRIITTFSTVETGAITNATRTEVEECTVTDPECPYGDVVWAQWDSWCPCDCKQGIRTRRRDCQKVGLISETSQKVPIALCQGEARQEEQCDARLKCPECFTDCTGLEPGEYPSCTSCSSYLSCQRNQPVRLLGCSEKDREWDAFVKSCVPAPSPSCSLHECVHNCTGVPDGSYHSCFGCNLFIECNNGQIQQRECQSDMEWNQHRKRCEAVRSPTCKRLANILGLSFIPGGGLQRDSANEIPDDERHKYLSNDVSDESKISNCKTHCRHTEEGKYPSCRGCSYYVICTKDNILHQKHCSGNRHWDDISKTCRRVSRTCTESV